MFRKLILASVAAVGLAFTSSADAQYFSPVPRPSHHQHYHVQYRTVNWQERTFFDLCAAREFEAVKAGQGYEAQTVQHGYHYNVRYRLPSWQSYRTVYSHRAAHDLERYLETRGYQARIVHH